MKFRMSITIFLVLALAGLVHSQWDYGFEFNKAGTAGLQFLKIGVGARESGMGEAALATTQGMTAIFWNPAGTAYVTGREATFSHSQWLLDIQFSAAAVGLEIGNWGVLGISVIQMGIPDFEETTVQAQSGTGRMVSAGDLALGISVARRFTDKLSMGAQVRYVREELDQDSFSNVLFDIGATYFTGFRQIRLAVCAQHFGPDIKMLRDKFRMPLIFKVGVADDLFHNDLQRLTLGFDLLHPTDNREHVNAGLEYGFLDKLFLRSGYRFGTDLGTWSFGAGLRQTLLGVTGVFDYAYSDFGEIMGGVNRLSVSFAF